MRGLPILALAILLVAGCTAPAATEEVANEEPIERTSLVSGDEARERAAPSAPPSNPPPSRIAQPPPIVAASPESPVDGARRVDGRSASFSWTPPSSSALVRLVVDGATRCEERVLRSCAIALEPGRRHSWHVETIMGTEVLRSPSWTLTTNGAPSLPVPLYPTSATRRWSPGEEIDFQASQDPDGDSISYTIEIRNVAGVVVAQCHDAGRTCVPSLSPGQSYSYRITATDGILSATSEPVLFITNSPPNAPIGAYPLPGTHSWVAGEALQAGWGGQLADPDAEVVTLRFEIARAGSGVSMVCEYPCVPALEEGTAYTYTPIATDGRLETRGATVPFRTNARPTIPALDPGDGGAEQWPLNLTIWEPGSTDPDGDVITYAMVISNPDGSEAGRCEVVGRVECSFNLPKFGRTYSVRLIASDGLLESQPSHFTFTTRRPVVLLHGWEGGPSIWAHMRAATDKFGFISPAYAPDGSGDRIEDFAVEVERRVDAILAAEGYPHGQRFDVVAHSMGGLITRVLVEGPNHGANRPWAERVGKVVMLGTPNEGSGWGRAYCADRSGWGVSACQMVPESAFYDTMNPAEPGRVRYFTIAGNWVNGGDGLVSTQSVDIGRAEETIVLQDICHSTAVPRCNTNGALTSATRPIEESIRILTMN